MSSQDFKYTIVVGGGLAGLSACHTILEHGGNVLLLDKNPFLGGNSTKATSGINGALTEAQIKKGIPDSWQKYAEDTAKSATKGKSKEPTPTQIVLCRESAPAIEWLQRRFGLDLSLVSQLGGQSYPRTHRGPEKFPGMTITYALMENLEKIEKETNGKRAQIKLKARVTKLLTENDEVIGVEYEQDGKTHKAYGPVVIATGGFGADFTPNGILAKVRPDLLKFSTTNGEHCTGDGIKIAEAIGADTVDLEWVQVHPTGLVDPSEPDAKVKFLAAEALRGVGGILLNGDGERFVDELQTRDFVSEQMAKNKPPFRLVLNGKAAKEIEWHCKHYVGRGLMKKLTGEELAKEIGIPVSKLKAVFDKYNQGARENKDEFGKKHFHNLPFDINDTFHVAQVCPLVHYCMGGLKIDENARVLSKKTGKPIPGLFAAGEVTGGVHGKNRLGGSSLTDCVVYGRVAGRSAAHYLMRKLLERKSSSVQFTPSSKDTTVGFTIKQEPVETSIEIKPLENNVLLNVKWRGAQSTIQSTETKLEQIPASTESQLPVESKKEEPTKKETKKELKVYTAEEVAKHNKENDCWVIVNGLVLDVTKFLPLHPGGKKAILLYAGRDASEEFNMLHDKDVIQKYAPDTIIGKIAGANVETTSTSPSSTPEATKSENAPGTFNARVYAKSDDDYSKPNNPISLKPIEPCQPSNTPSRNSGGTADILPQERKKATFDVKKMTIFLDGGEEKHARKQFIMSPISDVDFSDMYNWDRHTYIKKHIEHFIKVHKKFANYQPSRDEIGWMSDYYTLKGSLINHHGLFVSTLQGMASDEQKQWWLPKAMRFEIIGCYAQTELGHGSNVRGLQTIATYDKETQEFILNTPTLTSIKWWPGTLGKLATHALVYAQLILDGKEYGVHVFMVQIRDENHRPLPGIELGDLGAKLGDHANDTGFMRLENVRIPRTHMLARYQYVTPDGKYQKTEKKLNPKLHYATMMYTRGWMIGMGAGVLAKASTIATRYSCVRKQGFKNPSPDASYKSEEFPIIDYQVQRYRILRQIALTYVLKFTANWMQNKFSDLEGGKNDRKKLFVIEDVSSLPEIAATSAGLKALTTFIVAQGVEDLRKSCGGNGYLMSSGLAPLAADYVWQTTAEGDYIIMMLLTARFLLKSLQKARKEQVSGPVDYLNIIRQPGFNLNNVAPPQPTSWQQLLDFDYLQSLFKYRALSSIVNVGTQFAKRTAKGENFMDVWNSLSLELVNAVRNHCWYFMLRLSVEKIATAEDANIREVLKQLVQLFAISNILDDNWTGYLSEKQVRFAKEANTYLLDKLRPNAVALVDAFEIPDNVLNSVIGRYDGNVYEALFESAKKSELNRVDPFIGYEEVLRPHLDLEFLKNGNKPIKSKM